MSAASRVSRIRGILNQAPGTCAILLSVEGSIVAEGSPTEIITAENVERVFGLATVVIDDPVTGSPCAFRR
ncbi:MAG: hypothetical protein AAF547_00020 [Actinomycetota bacterium]